MVGKVARIFADRKRLLRRGERLSFDQPFTSGTAPGAGPTREIWARARAAEAYLVACEGGGWRVTCDQFTLLRRATFLWSVNPPNTDQGGFAEAPGLKPKRLPP